MQAGGQAGRVDVPFPFVLEGAIGCPSTSPTWLLIFAILAGVPASWTADRLLLVPVDMARAEPRADL